MLGSISNTVRLSSTFGRKLDRSFAGGSAGSPGQNERAGMGAFDAHGTAEKRGSKKLTVRPRQDRLIEGVLGG